MGSPEVEPTLRVLASAQRRSVCRYFREADVDVADLRDLAEFVLADAGGRSRSPGPEAREAVATELYHVHLPKLDSLGLVSFDPATRTVRFHGEMLVDGVLDELDEDGAVAMCD